MLTIDLTGVELAALVALIRRAIEEDHFPRAPRLDPLRSAMAKLDPVAAEALRSPPATKSPVPAHQQLRTPKGRPRGS